MNCTACGDPLPSLLSTYGPDKEPLCATCWFKGQSEQPTDDELGDVPLDLWLNTNVADIETARDRYTLPIDYTDSLVPPVDMLPCGWAGAQRVDPDGTVTADASVEAIKYR